MVRPGVNTVKGLLETARHSTGPATDETFSVPWAHEAAGRRSNSATSTNFLISPLSQVRQGPDESWSDRAANQCGENPNFPGQVQIHCRDQAADELSGRRGACRKYASFFPAPLASEIRPVNEPSSRSSSRHLPRKTKNRAAHCRGS